MEQNANDPLSQEEMTELFQRFRSAMDAGLYTDAEEIGEQFLGNAEEWYAQRCSNPTPYDRLSDEASRLLAGFDYAGSEAALLRILKLDNLSPYRAAATHGNLSALYRLLKREQESLEHARLASDAMRAPSCSNMPLAMMLRDQARRLLYFGHPVTATKIIAELQSLLEDIGVYDQLRADVLILQADCDVKMGQKNVSDADLETAFRLLEPTSRMSFAAGIRNSLAHYWRVIAQQQMMRNEWSDALDAMQRAVSLKQEIAQTPHCADVYAVAGLADALSDLSKTLNQMDRCDEAEQARSQCRSIWDFLRLDDCHSPA